MDSNTHTNTTSDEFSKVLRDEVEMLRPQAHDPAQGVEACADKAELVGLAFSGGGIRSATFCLGVIQALSRLSLLRTFDYLSTVSGGGYIGGWLSALIHRTRKPGQTVEEALADVERGLAGQEQPWCTANTTASDCPPEHPSLRFLRRFSNYLTPRLGLLSGDSLAAISTYLRNLVLNQLILVAFFGALLTLPYLLLSLARTLGDKEGFALTTLIGETGLPWIYGLAVPPMLFAVLGCAVSLKHHKEVSVRFIDQKIIVILVVLLSLMSAFFLAMAMRVDPNAAKYNMEQWVAWTAVAYQIPWMIIGWIQIGGGNLASTALEKVLAVYLARRKQQSPLAALKDLFDWASGVVRFFWQLPWTLLSGALGGVLFYYLTKGAHTLSDLGGIDYAVAFGTPLVLLSFSAVVTLHVGLMKRLYSENDREWWARLGGFILLAALIWAGTFAATLYAAPLVKWLAGLALAGGLAWVATSVGGVLLGKSTLTAGNGNAGKSQSMWGNLVLVAPYVFIIGLLIVLASVLNWVLTSDTFCKTCEPLTAGKFFAPILDTSLANINQVSLAAISAVGGACVAVFVLLGFRIDINLFSLHGFYRNRLTRCYLGATRLGKTVPTHIVRDPHPFTGFDAKDDLPLSKLAEQRPYPIINTAMNLCGGEDLAWQTRRAASFAFTPCHTGFEFWKSRGIRRGAYRCTQQYSAMQNRLSPPFPGGVLLGNVMATSGAAANPNMGYHTSAALSALMSVFNVRLGRWCGNTYHSDAWRWASPRFGGVSLIKEVFGMLDSKSPFLNLSDGGHFENLGIYELVRRRCHVVVAVDAGCDPDYQYEDLANAIRKCWTDFGTRIQIDLAAMRPKGKSRHISSHFAVGCIHYPNAGEPGILIYIKASLSGDEPTDVKEYAARNPSFPHQSTGDQFFNENQFESYRELGRDVGLKVFAPMFPPKEYKNENELEKDKVKPAKEMSPQELRDALPDRLPDHPGRVAGQTRQAIRPHP